MSDAPTPPERDALIANARSLSDALDHGDIDETEAALDPASEWISDAAEMLRADAEEIARLKARLADLEEQLAKAPRMLPPVMRPDLDDPTRWSGAPDA